MGKGMIVFLAIGVLLLCCCGFNEEGECCSHEDKIGNDERG